MKLIKLRFVYHRKNNIFCLQRMTWYGRWKYIYYTVNLGYGSISNIYSDKSKKALLNGVLEHYYKTTKQFVNIKEYPTIKLY